MTELDYILAIKVLYIGFTKIGNWWNYKNLSAPYWRLYWNNSDGAKIAFSAKEIALQPERIVLIPPDTAFSSHPPKDGTVDHFYVHFLLEGGRLKFKNIPYSFKIDVNTQSLMNEIIFQHDTNEQLKAELKTISLLTQFLSQAPIQKLEANYSGRISSAINFIKNHIEKGISNDELAERFYMSRNSFLRLFKKSTGISPQKYLKILRIQRACHLLHYSEKSIKEIASELGFCDRYHFSKTFTSMRGESPGAFRKKLYFRKLNT